MRHLQANFSSSIADKTVVGMVQKLVCAHNTYKFGKIWDKMAEKCVAGTTWLDRINHGNKTNWAISYDTGGRRWGIPTSNNAEVMNFVFKGVRKLPVTAIVEATFYKLNSYHVRYRAAAELREHRWTDKVMEKMERRHNKARTHTVTLFNLDQGNYQVVSPARRSRSGIGIPRKTWGVNITEGQCECQKPMIYHMPCSHIIAVCIHRGISHEAFIHPCYSIEYLKRSYENSFYPVKERSQWSKRDEVCSFTLFPGEKLVRKNQDGRMKRGRRREVRYHNTMDTMYKEKRTKNCSVCKQAGHTKPRCTQPGGGRYNGPS